MASGLTVVPFKRRPAPPSIDDGWSRRTYVCAHRDCARKVIVAIPDLQEVVEVENAWATWRMRLIGKANPLAQTIACIRIDDNGERSGINGMASMMNVREHDDGTRWGERTVLFDLVTCRRHSRNWLQRLLDAIPGVGQ